MKENITDNEKKEILEIAEEIAFSIVGDVADNEDASSVAPIAEALYEAGYRKQGGHDMKCPKCGSENIFYNTSYDGKDYYICGNCKTHYSLPTVAVSKTELTTAKMLLWLVENNYVITRSLPSYEMSGSICKAFDSYPSFRFGYIGMDRPLITLAEAIKQAYEWAKEASNDRD